MKKVVVLIVEGTTDENALYYGLQQLCIPNRLEVEVIRMDLFSIDKKNYNILNEIGNVINKLCSKRRIKKSDILHVAHITDLDGCFLKHDNIVVRSDFSFIGDSEWVYHDDMVFTKTTEKQTDLRKRNEVKSRNTSIVYSKSSIAGVNYGLYYMAANLEHVINDEPNSTESQKYDFSDSFEASVIQDPNFFRMFFEKELICPFDDYIESWNSIMIESNSMKGYSNLRFLFERIDLLCSTGC